MRSSRQQQQKRVNGVWLQDPIDEIEGIDIVANEKQKLDITAAISNSFGFGGHNSSCVFAPFKE